MSCRAVTREVRIIGFIEEPRNKILLAVAGGYSPDVPDNLARVSMLENQEFRNVGGRRLSTLLGHSRAFAGGNGSPLPLSIALLRPTNQPTFSLPAFKSQYSRRCCQASPLGTPRAATAEECAARMARSRTNVNLLIAVQPDIADVANSSHSQMLVLFDAYVLEAIALLALACDSVPEP
jgi:hypothetical protein